MREVRIRHVESTEDRARSLEIHNAVVPRRAVALEDVLDYERLFPQKQLLLAELDGELVGASHAALSEALEEASALAYVLPHGRGHGVGRALYAAISAWAREVGRETLRTSVDADDSGSLAWAQRRGFVEQSRDSILVLELEGLELPDVPPPEGVELVTWAERPELTRGIYEVYCEADPDIPGEESAQLLSFERWLEEDMGGRGDRPEATFLALAGGEVVGFAKFSLTEARPDTAFHDLTGVRRAWRGRGVARALKARQIAWAQERGYARLETFNEERNEPIRRINERFGYREEAGRIVLVGPAS